MKKLITQRSKYEEQLNSGSEYVKATRSGIVSYKIDGLEEVLTPNNFNNLSKKTLEDLNLKTGKIISSNQESGKIVNNFECYIAVILNSEEAQKVEIGKKLKIRLSGEEETSAIISHKSKESEDEILLVLKIDKVTQDLINYRKIAVDIIWWSDSGLKVPNQAIIEEEGKKYIVRNRAGYLNKLLINVLRTNGKYSIVDAYSTDELKELGWSVSDILSYKKITIYDEILLNPNIEK